MRKRAALAAAGSLVVFGACADARSLADVSSGASLAPVFACQAEKTDASRLACYDAAVATLRSAASDHEVAVINRQDIAKARRSLFGFSVPSFDFLDVGRNEDRRGTVSEDASMSSTVRNASQDGEGNWTFTLEDGAIWHQTSGFLAVAPKSGDKVEIRRAALGSYFMRIGHQPGFKAKREG